MRHVAAFARLSRLQFLLGGFAAFALGAAVAATAGVPIAPGAYALGQAMVTAFHLMTHYANEYFDRAADRRGTPTAFAGGSGVLVAGALRPRVALIAALTCAGLGLGPVAAFLADGRPAPAALGIAIGSLAWAYSAPPVRLAARGWGEAGTALVVGVLVPFAGYTSVGGALDGRIAIATLAPAAAMFAMMLAVELPDWPADDASGKRNLVVRCGPTRARRLAAVAAALVAPALALTFAFAPTSRRAALLFPLLLLPVGVGFVLRARRPQTLPTELAARGVALFLLTVLFELLGELAVG